MGGQRRRNLYLNATRGIERDKCWDEQSASLNGQLCCADLEGTSPSSEGDIHCLVALPAITSNENHAIATQYLLGLP